MLFVRLNRSPSEEYRKAIRRFRRLPGFRPTRLGIIRLSNTQNSRHLLPDPGNLLIHEASQTDHEESQISANNWSTKNMKEIRRGAKYLVPSVIDRLALFCEIWEICG
jgi:hypothetical protein